MQREWVIPNFEALELKFTEFVGPTPFVGSTPTPTPTHNSVSFFAAGDLPGDNYDWTCKCCGARKVGFNTEAEAKKDFVDNHQLKCPKWNYDLGLCGIS